MIFQSLFWPSDPSLLAFFRICFGICMMVDIPQERGMARADSIYGDGTSPGCTFPLIHGMKPLSRDVMVVLYAVLFINAFFITIGYFYRLNVLLFTIIYWYFFLLNTAMWNNHSYLYGLLALLLSVTNGHHFMSLDGLLFDNKQNADIPRWNYMLFRFQVFIVYFYAGLKKTEVDWITGYSMSNLSKEWVFDPLRSFLSNEDIDFYVVHICGFLFDISVGFLLLFDMTRIFGFILCVTFHGLNSMIFNIGMFPYVMMASSLIFCDPKGFKYFVSKLLFLNRLAIVKPSQRNADCVYFSEENLKDRPSNWTWSQVLAIIFCSCYMSSQAFLPYSHFITKGYNGWTQGLYGYSWDMMVHSFTNQHVRISYKNLRNGDVGYLKPNVLLNSKKSRWTTQPAMAYQYALCIKQELKNLGIEDSAVYFDVWKSMNKRFQQRVFDPMVDISSYPWSPFEEATFVKPLLSDFSYWREELKRIKSDLKNTTSEYSIVFVADFPGLYLENYVSEDLGNATLHVLRGEIVVEREGMLNKSLTAGKDYQVPPGEFHRVYTVSDEPSCYYYIYMNKTIKSVKDRLQEYENLLMQKEKDVGQNAEDDDTSILEIGQDVIELYNKEQRYRQLRRKATSWGYLSKFLYKKTGLFRRSFLLLCFSIRNLVVGKPIDEVLDSEARYLDSWFHYRDPFDGGSATDAKDGRVDL